MSADRTHRGSAGRPSARPTPQPQHATPRRSLSPRPTVRALPVTATALASCLFVSVAASPAQAAAVVSGSTPGFVTIAGQQYTAPAGSTLDLRRDGFDASAPVVVATTGASTGASTGTSTGAPAVTVTADPGSGGAAVRPVAGSVPTAGGFGGRHVAGCAACSTNHQGLDFAAPAGTPIVSVLPGTVVHAGPEGGYGLSVVVQHADGIVTRYGHMSVVQAAVGQPVAAGTQIGLVGSTGVSTGAHLHFEVLVAGIHVDPAGWLRAQGL